jgi:hypothetical protein
MAEQTSKQLSNTIRAKEQKVVKLKKEITTEMDVIKKLKASMAEAKKKEAAAAAAAKAKAKPKAKPKAKASKKC